MDQLSLSDNSILAILALSSIIYLIICLLKPSWGSLILLVISGLSIGLPGSKNSDQGVNIQNIFLLLMCIVVLKDILIVNKRLVYSKLIGPIIVVILSMAFSTFFVEFHNNDILINRIAEFKRNVSYLLFFIIFANVDLRKSSFIEFVVVFILSALAMGVFSTHNFSNLIQMHSINTYRDIQENLSVVAQFGAGYACTPVMAILVLLSIYTSKGLSPLLKWGIPLMVAALALPVFFFFERGMIGLLGMGVLLWLGSQRRVGAFFTAVLIGLLIFLAAPDVLTEQWTARIADSISWEGGTNLTIQTTGRSEKNWPNAIKTIQESFPLGIGLGNNKVLDFAPHNQYLRWLGEFGLLGFLAMMWLLLAIWKELGRHLRSPFPLYRKTAQGLRLFFLSFLVYSLLNDPFFYSWLYFFLALMGLMVNPSIARYHLRQLCSRQSYESHRLTCHYSPNV